MTRVAAIDCGTNSIRLLVADHDPAAGTLTDRLRRTELVRLGQGVDRTGRLAPEAIERTRVALASYAADCEREQVEQVRMVATSATRDAANRDDFRAMVLRTLGAEPEVISGREEAELSFVGAVRELTDTATPRLVADIGGGSTELVLGDGDRRGRLQHGHRLGAADRAAPARRPAHRRADRRGRARTCSMRSPPPAATCRSSGRVRSSASPAR